MESRNARYGLILLTIYLLFYGGFVLLNAFAQAVMEKHPFSGINLAILYGFGLIIVVLILSLIYGWIHSFLHNREDEQ